MSGAINTGRRFVSRRAWHPCGAIVNMPVRPGMTEAEAIESIRSRLPAGWTLVDPTVS